MCVWVTLDVYASFSLFLPVQIVESEKTAKWQYTVQCEQLASEIKKLRSEVSSSVLRQKLYEVNLSHY